MTFVSGPDLIARSISGCQIPDKYGNAWQYHSRSDRHSKIACWVIAFDLVRRCELLREHVAAGKVIIGVNHKMRDFQTRREKNLDLVIAEPASSDATKGTMASLATRLGVEVATAEMGAFANVPVASRPAVGSVLVALEAKAAMTAHVRALPRLHDELDSSHAITHGNSERALAVGFVMVNAAPTFRSPDMNKFDMSKVFANVNQHKQPADAQRVIDKISEIRRRSGSSGTGFDAMGMMVVEMANDGSPMTVVDVPPPTFTYEEMVKRVVHEYAANFSKL